MDYGIVPLGDTLYFAELVKDSDGAIAAPDGDVTYQIYAADLSGPISNGSGSMAQVGSVTGFYSAEKVIQIADTYVAGERYVLKTAWEVSAVPGGNLHTFQVA